STSLASRIEFPTMTAIQLFACTNLVRRLPTISHAKAKPASAVRSFPSEEIATVNSTERGFQPQTIAPDLLHRFESEADVLSRGGFGIPGLACDHGSRNREMLFEQLIAHSLSQIELRAIVENIVAQKIGEGTHDMQQNHVVTCLI